MLARRCCQAAKPPSTTRAVMATPLSTKPVTSVVVKPGRTQPRQTPRVNHRAAEQCRMAHGRIDTIVSRRRRVDEDLAADLAVRELVRMHLEVQQAGLEEVDLLVGQDRRAFDRRVGPASTPAIEHQSLSEPSLARATEANEHAYESSVRITGPLSFSSAGPWMCTALGRCTSCLRLYVICVGADR